MPAMGVASVLDFDPLAFLGGIAKGKTTRTYRSKQIVFSQGDAVDAVFYVCSGRVEISVVSARGKEALIAVLPHGSFFGEGCLAGQPLRMSTATATRPSSIVRVQKGTMLRLLHREPEFAELFLAYLLSRNLRIEKDLVSQLFNSSEKRLARTLLLLARFGRKSKPKSVIQAVSEKTLAAMVGTTRSKVRFFLARFRKLGFIAYDNGLHVHSALLNVLLRD
jgi:CRP/FNR family transcriptional regulator, cyclic AMP receptor protein